MRSWVRGGAHGAASVVQLPEQRELAGPAYLTFLQAFLPDGYPASVTPDYLRAPLPQLLALINVLAFI